MHIASAPGEAPAIDTGKLFADIKVKYRDLGMTAIVGTTGTGYAGYLEEGTRKMFPRPFALPAYNEYRSRFMETLTLALSRIN
jgi:HK97 gp10 family phage protein